MSRAIRAQQHIAATVGNVTVYHVLRWCGQIWMQYWFTTNPADIGTECAGSHFDARDVPAQYQQPGQTPIEWVCSAVRAGFDLDSITNAQPSTAPQTEITMRQISQPANPVFYGIDRCLSDADRPVMFTTPNPFIAAACDQSGQVCALEIEAAVQKMKVQGGAA